MAAGLPAFFRSHEFLDIDNHTDGRHDRLIDEHIDDEADPILSHCEAELIEYSFLFSVHDHHDEKGEWYHKQRYRADDVVMTEECENHAGQKDESVEEVDKRDDEIYTDKKSR